MQSLNYNSACSCVAYISHMNISFSIVHKLSIPNDGYMINQNNVREY
jgi:hypothetical protein